MNKHILCTLGLHWFKFQSKKIKYFDDSMRKFSAKIGNYNNCGVTEKYECKYCGKTNYEHTTDFIL